MSFVRETVPPVVYPAGISFDVVVRPSIVPPTPPLLAIEPVSLLPLAFTITFPSRTSAAVAVTDVTS